MAPPSILSLCCVASGVPMELILKEEEGACKPCSSVSLSRPTSCAMGTPVAALVARSPPAPNSSSPRGMPSPSPRDGEEEKEDPALAGPTGTGLCAEERDRVGVGSCEVEAEFEGEGVGEAELRVSGHKHKDWLDLQQKGTTMGARALGEQGIHGGRALSGGEHSHFS